MPVIINQVPYSHDKLWKIVIEDFSLEFIRYFFPQLVGLIDFSRRPRLLNKNLKQLFVDAGTDRRADVLIEYTLKSGAKEYLLVHIEVQEYYDKQFAQRMFEYYYRILAHFDHEVDLSAMAILADDRPSFKPDTYQKESLGGTELRYKFKTFKLLDYTSEQLRRDDNPFGFIMETARRYLDVKDGTDAEKRALQRQMVRRLRELDYPDEHISILLRFVRDFIIFKAKSNYKDFDTELIEDNKLGRNMGMLQTIAVDNRLIGKAEGRTEGKTEGKIEGKIEGIDEKAERVAVRLLKKKKLSVEDIAETVEKDVSYVLTIQQRIDQGEL